MTTASKTMVSVGALSARCNAPLTRVIKAVEALDIRPAMTIDSVVHLDEDDAQRVAEWLVERRQTGDRQG